MKNLLIILSFVIAVFPAIAQDEMKVDSTGLPGDYFSLEGALDLFQKSASLEAFEKSLNTEENHINNLDLNGDGDIDYVKVISKQEGDIHIFILQVPVSESENQDIAVLELEKTFNEQARLQIIGDEDIYGEMVIVEPSYEKKDVKPGVDIADVPVNVWYWRPVKYIYSPGYRLWVSPWRWQQYPTYWKPWRPMGWAVWHPFRVVHHRPTVRMVSTHRVVRAHGLYKPLRVTSSTVRTKHAGAHANYKVTRTKTKVKGPKGNSVTKKTTTVKGSKGNVRAKKTTVKKSRKG